jgi:hypothetical protein
MPLDDAVDSFDSHDAWSFTDNLRQRHEDVLPNTVSIMTQVALWGDKLRLSHDANLDQRGLIQVVLDTSRQQDGIYAWQVGVTDLPRPADRLTSSTHSRLVTMLIVSPVDCVANYSQIDMQGRSLQSMSLQSDGMLCPGPLFGLICGLAQYEELDLAANNFRDNKRAIAVELIKLERETVDRECFLQSKRRSQMIDSLNRLGWGDESESELGRLCSKIRIIIAHGTHIATIAVWILRLHLETMCLPSVEALIVSSCYI